jgi:hypothetical protein
MIRQKKTMKMSYCQPQGHTCHFTCQRDNLFKIIKIVKQLNFLDNRFFRQQLFKKSHFSDKRVPDKQNQTCISIFAWHCCWDFEILRVAPPFAFVVALSSLHPHTGCCRVLSKFRTFTFGATISKYTA